MAYTGYVRHRDTKKGNSYQIVVNLPPKQDGSRNRHTETFHGTKKQAENDYIKLFHNMKVEILLYQTNLQLMNFYKNGFKPTFSLHENHLHMMAMSK